MTVHDIPVLVPTENWDVMNAIRNQSSDEYRRMVPEATRASQQEAIAALQTYRPNKNEFIGALVNKIGMTTARQQSWTNPMAIFKRSMLTAGDTIEEVSTDRIAADRYDPDREYLEKGLFGTAKVPTQTSYHTISREDRYKVTVDPKMLQRAFLEQHGLTNFVQSFIGASIYSDNIDEFNQTCKLFALYEENGGFHKIHVPAIADLESNDDDARKALRVLRATADNLTFPARKYNAAKQMLVAKREDLVIFTTPEFKAAVDVEALAAAFSLSHAEISTRMITIPKSAFGIDGVEAIMTTSEFFVIADTILETSSLANPGNLRMNHWLHHHGIISSSRFVPAVAFTTGPGDEDVVVIDKVASVNDIAVSDRENTTVTDVKRGEMYNVASAAVTESGGTDGVRYSVSGNTSFTTMITQTGVLHVSGVEGATTLKVRATAVYRTPDDLMKDGIFKETTITVSGKSTAVWPVANGPFSPTVAGIKIAGVAVSPVFAADTLAYTATVVGWDGDPESVVVSGVDRGDLKITVSANKGTVKVYAPGTPNDPTYTITVTLV